MSVRLRTPRRATRRVASAAFVVALLAGAQLGAGPVGAAPSVTVIPAADLRDSQEVTVTGDGYQPGQFVDVHQCAANGEDCLWSGSTYPLVGGDGRFSVSHRVDAIIFGLVDADCRIEQCVLVVSTGGDGAEFAIPLHFDPDAPLRPPPTVVVEPTSGLADGTPVHVVGTGFAPDRTVVVEQCPAGFPGAPCDTGSAHPSAGPDGHIEASLTAWIDLAAWDGTATPCDVAPGCEIVVRDDQRNTIRTPITFEPRLPSRGRYLDPIFDEVEVERDIVYRSTIDSRGNPIDLKLDVYQPVGDTEFPRPAVVWFHGGYFSFGDKDDMEGYARAFARRGYVTASVQYRLRPEIGGTIDGRTIDAMLDAYDDADAAIAWLRAHHAEYGIEPGAIAAGGYSAGAVTSLNLAYLPGQRGPATSRIAAAVSIAGFSVGTPETGEPSSLVFHGTEDAIVPYAAGEGTCATVNAAGLLCELVSFAGSGHEIVGTRQRDIERRTADFLGDRVLRPLGFLPPVLAVDAGGPYSVPEGSAVQLVGSASNAAKRVALDWSWEPTDDLRRATTPRPTFVARDDGTNPLILRARQGSAVAEASTTVQTINVAPVLARVTTTRVKGQVRSRSVFAQVRDVGRDDTHRGVVDWGDGRWSVAGVDQAKGWAALRATHDYGTDGRFRVRVFAIDDDGGLVTTTRDIVVG